ncbi:MAG: hypothetical protein CMF96_04235 [Candidatus Marinimicrobia bacterium]|nr:hypothetical protein [Candidatus Neomarinimicrobiota bacterium]
MENKYYIGVDIGGTTFCSGLFDYKRNLIIKSNKESIVNYKNQKLLIKAILNQINFLLKDYNIIGIGISCPGPLDSKNGKILNTPNLTLLQNCNLINILESNLNVPCKIENDANLFSLGEYYTLKYKEEVTVGVTLGTGIGFGIVINGKLFTGGNGMAAEYGISPINNTNWESYNSIRWLEEAAIEKFSIRHTPKEIFKLAQNNSKKAIHIWEEFGHNLGICLSHIINMIDPNNISIGGGLSHAFKFFNNKMIETIEIHSPSYKENNIKIYESKLKEDAALLGATLLF